MALEYRYIEDDLRTVIQSVSDVITPKLQIYDSKITGVHYWFGTKLEIIETLTQKSKNNTDKFQKYPLVCLFIDVDENKGVQKGNIEDLKLNMAIIYGTLNNFKAYERLEKTFKPVIMPIYFELLNQISLNGNMFLGAYPVNNIKHKIARKYRWGETPISGDNQNMIQDYVDGLELTLELKYYFNRC